MFFLVIIFFCIPNFIPIRLVTSSHGNTFRKLVLANKRRHENVSTNDVIKRISGVNCTNLSSDCFKKLGYLSNIYFLKNGLAFFKQFPERVDEVETWPKRLWEICKRRKRDRRDPNCRSSRREHQVHLCWKGNKFEWWTNVQDFNFWPTWPPY